MAEETVALEETLIGHGMTRCRSSKAENVMTIPARSYATPLPRSPIAEQKPFAMLGQTLPIMDSAKLRARLRKYSRILAISWNGASPWPKGAANGRIHLPLPWEKECERFFAALKKFDDYLASQKPLEVSAEKLFQGPIADALTHVGQIAMLRRMAGVPMKGENYFVAEITVGHVGSDQAPPRKEF